MAIPPYSNTLKIPPNDYKDIDFLEEFGGIPAQYIKMKPDLSAKILFEVGGRWIDFPEYAPANVWMNIEEEISTLRIENPSTTTTMTVRIYATTTVIPKEAPTAVTKIVPSTIGVE